MTTSQQVNAMLASANPADFAVSQSASTSLRKLGTLLVADDDPVVRTSLEQLLKHSGYVVVTACNGKEALQCVNDDLVLALLDLRMPQTTGMECLATIHREHPELQVIVITSSEEVSDAVEAMKAGAFDYIRKPCDAEELLVRVRQGVQKTQLLRDNQGLRQLIGQASSGTDQVSLVPTDRDLQEQIQRLAPLDSTVMITGESGVGKTTIARMLHERGPRAARPFVAVNCASLPRDLIEAELFGHCRGAFTGAISDRPGRVESAAGGTLFLDEIGDLPLDLQPKLLTFLQDRTVQRIGSNDMKVVDVRLIVATHQDLSLMCQEKRFREDLYYRLNVLRIHVPPLRERVDEIPQLVQAVLARLSSRRTSGPLRISDGVVNLLQGQRWPGNIRELENVLERAAAFCQHNFIKENDTMLNCDTPSNLTDKAPHISPLAGRTLADLEKQAIIDTLDLCRGNKAQTARVLGISEKSIYNKMRRHGLSKPAVAKVSMEMSS
ncbi:MAG: sigma-54-dependent Fis family transcriptional regulator [Planctomycetales bacterium]|nr:sigma-54-dependent Fis family transcriptional regulator [Planctomycetales bacterium]MCA9168081.1 sigma-54-dependent Fis family transcriptional regulator [Planctomycetales bacterium]